MFQRPAFAAPPHLICLALTATFGMACSGDDNEKSAQERCEDADYCEFDEAENKARCEPGFTWEDPDDSDNFNCVEMRTNRPSSGEPSGPHRRARRFDAALVGRTRAQPSPPPEPEPGPQCDPGWELCGDACVDVQNDTEHCGGCSPCADGQVCDGGSCVNPPECRDVPCVGLSYCDLATGASLPGSTSTDQCGTNETCNLSTRLRMRHRVLVLQRSLQCRRR